VEEDQPVTAELLEDEALAAEEPGADALRERDGDIHAPCATEKCVLLRDDGAAPLLEVDCLDLAGEGRRERHVATQGGFVQEDRDEERIAGQYALPCAEQAVHELGVPAALHVQGRHHPDAILHVHHGAGFGHDGLFRIEGHDNGLQVVANELVVDFIRGHGWSGLMWDSVVASILTGWGFTCERRAMTEVGSTT
jgi:hypothetical protein